MKAAVMSFLVLAALAMGGIGFYSTTAVADRHAADGYGISSAIR